MTKRQSRKEAYKSIVKNRQSHQETFDTLKKSGSMGAEALAEEISKIPSYSKNKSQQTLIYWFIATLSIIIVLRLFGIISLFSLERINAAVIVLAALIGILVPAIGIFGALTSRVEFYRTVGILMILSILRTFSNGNIPNSPIEYLVFVPFVIAAALAFYIPTKLKTNYTKKVVKQEVDGQVKTRLQFTFESELNDDGLLDSDLS